MDLSDVDLARVEQTAARSIAADEQLAALLGPKHESPVRERIAKTRSDLAAIRALVRRESDGDKHLP